MDIFYNPTHDKQITQGHLPHWTQQGKLHFITFRLADSLPQERLAQIRHERQEWDALHSQPYSAQDWQDYYQLFSERVENWLDAGSGECLLSRNEYAEIVVNSICHFENRRYMLDHWVVMPNHVHILLLPFEPYTLDAILHSLKSFTANMINRKRGSKGSFWQRESFDHIVRNELQLKKYRFYILENWKKSGYKAVISKQEIM